ncbi:hypothetical protein D3C83_36010 [compost metagenome]
MNTPSHVESKVRSTVTWLPLTVAVPTVTPVSAASCRSFRNASTKSSATASVPPGNVMVRSVVTDSPEGMSPPESVMV